mmetsp:Transcript_27014/g.59057  ORF Transcript_27014/g.59057 Transcript_27014/m.59057 type:complete len:91 (+) Transcript_27014:768-1040(+)
MIVSRTDKHHKVVLVLMTLLILLPLLPPLAFVACGGNADKTGRVKRETLIKIIKHDFGLTINLEELMEKIGADGSGEIEYEEFRVLLSAS